MGFVVFGLRPLTIYFTLIFELLLENYMADCRHFRCELYHFGKRNFNCQIVVLSPPGGAKHEKKPNFPQSASNTTPTHVGKTECMHGYNVYETLTKLVKFLVPGS